MSRFHWAACQIDELKKCCTEIALKKALKSLPKTLESTYDKMLQRINEDDAGYIGYAIIFLSWLVLGMHPLKLEELCVIVTFNPSMRGFNSGLKLHHPDDVLEICSSLVTKSENNIVFLAHSSVKEYFLRKCRTIGANPVVICDVGVGHASISMGCLAYL